jgi:sugar phosphate isomerase/epimerase
MSAENGLQIGVSTGSFVEFKPREALKLPGYLVGRPYIPEIVAGVSAARDLDIGLEIAYRKRADKQVVEMIENERVKVLQIHGPIFFNILDSLKQGRQEDSVKMGIALDFFNTALAGGGLKSEFRNNIKLAEQLGVGQIVIHPRGAEMLHDSGLLSLTTKAYGGEGISIAIEPDWKRQNASRNWVWHWEEASEIANKTSTGICMDVSHTVISHNSLKYLGDIFNYYQANTKGVLAIHFNAAVPWSDKSEIHKGWGALPMYTNIDELVENQPAVLGAYREFWQHIKQSGFSGPVIIEVYSYKRGEHTFDEKIKAIAETVNFLEGGH